MALCVDGVWRGSSRTAPDGGTTCCVGDVHSVAEQLGDQTSVSGLSTASAGAGELEQRFLELAALNGLFSRHAWLLANVGNQVIEYRLFCFLALSWNHLDGLFFGRALAYADAAAHAVHRGNSHGEFVVFQALADHLRGLQASRCSSNLFFGQRERTDGRVRADIRAAVALDALGLVPLRNHNGYAAFLISGSALLEGTVSMRNECGYRQAVAVHLADRLHDVLDHGDQLGRTFNVLFSLVVLSGCPVSRNVDLDIVVEAGVDGVVVHLHDSLALLGEAAGRCILHVTDRVLFWQNVCQSEEGRLQDGVGAFAQTDLDCLVDRVDGVQLDVVLGDVAFCFSRHVLVELFRSPLAVDQEDAARFYVANHLVALGYIGRVVAGNKVSLVDVVWALDRLVAKAQVRDGDTAGLFGVILEVCLYIFIGVVADDLDGVLVRTNSTVAAQAPELALDGAFCSGVRRFLLFQRQVGNVVVDAQGESCFRSILCKLFINGEDAGRGGVLGAQTIAAADDGSLASSFAHRRHNIQVQRLCVSAWLFGAVQNSDLGRGLRNSSQQVFCRERTVQSYFYKTNLLALCGQVVDYFLGDVADGAHRDDDAVSVRCAVVVEQLIVGAQLGVDLAHVLLNDSRNCLVVLVAGLAVLEEDVAVLVGTAHGWVLRVECAFAECFYCIHVAHLFEVFIVPNLDLLDLVGGAEAVEEVDERNAALDGSQVRNSAQVHNFLRVCLSQHGKAGLAAGVNVGVVAEDVQRVGSNGSRGNMEYRWQQFAGDLVHVRDHQQQALRRGVGGGQRAGVQRAVYSTCGASLRLHLHYLNGGAEDVLLSLCRPLIHIVSHRAGWSDRVDTGNFGKRVGYIRGRVVAVHGFHRSSHNVLFLLDRFCWMLCSSISHIPTL